MDRVSVVLAHHIVFARAAWGTSKDSSQLGLNSTSNRVDPWQSTYSEMAGHGRPIRSMVFPFSLWGHDLVRKNPLAKVPQVSKHNMYVCVMEFYSV